VLVALVARHDRTETGAEVAFDRRFLMNEEGLYSTLFWRMPVPSFVLRLGVDGDLIFDGVNLLFTEYAGLQQEDIIGRRPEEIPGVVGEAAGVLREDCRRCVETGAVMLCELPPGDEDQMGSQPVLLTPVRCGADDPVHVVGSFATFQHRAEMELRESRDLLQAIIDAVPAAIVGLDLDGMVRTVWNKGAERMLGWSAEEVMGKPMPSVPAERQEEYRAFGELIRSGASIEGVEVRRVRRDGSPIDYAGYTSLLRDSKGNPTGNISILVDLTERKQAEDALRESEREKTVLNEIANIFLTVPDEAMYAEVLAVVLNEMSSEFGILGYLGESGDLVIPSLTRHVWDQCQVPEKSIVFPADSWGHSLWGRAIREKKTFVSEGPFGTPEGHVRIDSFLTVPIVYKNETIGLLSVANKPAGYSDRDRELLERIVKKISPVLNARLQRDMQEQRRIGTEADLRESEEKYRLLVAKAGEAIFVLQDEVVKFPNPKALEMSGYSAEELAETPFLSLVHPSDRDTVLAGYSKLLTEEFPQDVNPFRVVTKQGKEIWVQLSAASVVWEKKPGILCLVRDVTHERRLEEQSVQAQKMEAVGRVAGGVAHDFNNMLTVIIGNTELALRGLSPGDKFHEELQEIDEVARRSADLTKQLLAFARAQTIAPKVLDLNGAVSGLLEMLRRLIGEDVDLAWRPGAGLWRVKMDPSQVDQIVANLCVNARDAIEGVGKVTIETGNAGFDEAYCADHPGFLPGDYVLLAVSDDGCGMDDDARAHLFEPFFTTKGLGRGTGLGLATVYGAVKQNNGFINTYTEPGLGTTFKLYFPRFEGEVTEPRTPGGAEVSPRGTETVLIVEDERSILILGSRILKELGYLVLVAKSPDEALRLAEAHAGPIHLLITDVVMPGMNGRVLAERLASLKPGLRCLFMSGYTANVIAHRGVLDEGVRFIQKPFSTNGLATKVRQSLDE
jgi:two-component system, cell cycle sensor histidine kinase and response regulator CckA